MIEKAAEKLVNSMPVSISHYNPVVITWYKHYLKKSPNMPISSIKSAKLKFMK